MSENRSLTYSHWWQNWKWIASIAFLIFSIGVFVIGVSSIQATNKLDTQTNILERLDNNQKGIDELVGFVHDVQEQQSTSSGQSGQSKVVSDIIHLLCSSSDPERISACKQLGYEPVGG